jgi:hypothetical protein
MFPLSKRQKIDMYDAKISFNNNIRENASFIRNLLWPPQNLEFRELYPCVNQKDELEKILN